ncbi:MULTISPECIES: LysR family transcriptional regulator [Pseudoalteromonas]|uniref:LysR family transcriptional regulator n=1 Tax=Pseudoalteromonas fuliginea TaxID=1872678 RepID=A0ABD3Y8G0_9GAMM|nr:MULTISPECIES: LysR family transcriptional regulator [Pseudoalteromonas]ALQ09250.1 LysR family transcriptional regulator [Pseudoalteromonas sp. Bsw20308]KDC50819.1 LysR family transcriptional regulator [Pseudoalteromonas fuliginea]KDC55201.1 LysR family transcriptional regulator [Pseudoalteromonas sp. S3431]KJZ26859.1 LysR family transcriptional regulator [Pseudoalteromonas fuliginea]
MAKATLEQWRMFKAVVDHGGFAGASAAVHKSQSTVHHAVQKLEVALQIKLLEVKGRKAFLTDSGKLILRRAEFLIEEASKIESVANTLSEGVESTLKIAVDEVFPHPILYQALARTSELFPLLKIDLIESVLTGANELLNNAVVDLAISSIPIYGISCNQLCDIEFVAVAHPNHPLHQRTETLSFRDLKLYRQIVVRDSGTQTSHDEGWLGADMRWTVSHLRNSIDMVSQNLGYAWLPRTQVSHLIEEEKLKVLNLEQGTTRALKLYLMCNDTDRLGPAAQEFKEQLINLSLD